MISWGVTAAALIVAATGMVSRRWSKASNLLLSVGILVLGISGLIRGTEIEIFQGQISLSVLGSWFLIVLGVVATMSSWYSHGYSSHGGSTQIWLPVFLMSMAAVLLSGNVWMFMTAWELMAISSYFLVITDHSRPGVLRAGFIYLVMSQVSAMLILLGFMIVSSQLHSFDFSVWAQQAHTLSGTSKNWVFLLLGLGFGIKSGIVPFHIWLPEAHPAAPAPISGLMSGAMIKLGIFGILQFLLLDLGPTNHLLALVLLAAGAVSALFGVLYALMEHDLKRLLAYHSIENIGIILLGVGIMAVGMDWHLPVLVSLGLAAALLHTLNHAIFKTQLFLVAGAVEMHSGTLDADDLGGLIRTMPQMAIGFLIGSMAITALPPFNGFVSEWLVMRGLLGISSHFSSLLAGYGLLLAAVLGLTGALAGICFVKAFGVIFLGEPRKPVAKNIIPASMTWPVLVLGFLSLLLGIFPQPLLRLLGGTGNKFGANPTGFSGLLVPDGVVIVAVILLVLTVFLVWASRIGAVKTVPRWACGRVSDASMQFTSASFTKAIRTTFAVIYRPHRKLEYIGEYSPDFVDRVIYEGGTVPIWDRYIYRPMFRFTWKLSHFSTRIQAGPVRLYLAYVLGAVGLMIAAIH